MCAVLINMQKRYNCNYVCSNLSKREQHREIVLFSRRKRDNFVRQLPTPNGITLLLLHLSTGMHEFSCEETGVVSILAVQYFS